MQGIVRMNDRQKERLKKCLRMSLRRRENWLDVLEEYDKLRKNAKITGKIGRIIKQA